MPIIKGDGIAISHTPGARQIVILSHGGWKIRKSSRSGDSWTKAPDGATVNFYTVDGQFAIGNRVFDEVTRAPADAYGGKLDKSRFPHQQRCSGEQAIKDYALYEDDRPAAANYWRDHCAGQAPSYHADVDLAIVTISGHKRHLSKVFELAEAHKLGYEQYHAAFCRVTR